ncbi:MAG: acetolactate synthase 2 small subunit [Gammaproteobacteria bacterium]|nr:acetolactate synthase 2 small subunit [Gammaproteobacteria bacterium]
MMHTFNVTLADKPAVLERLLRVIRHRGYRLLSMNVKSSGDELSMQISVVSKKPAMQLVHQLDKLYDVINIKQQ